MKDVGVYSFFRGNDSGLVVLVIICSLGYVEEGNVG